MHRATSPLFAAFTALTALALSLAACGAEAPAGTGSASEQLVSRAVVHFAPDGTYTIQYSEITSAEQQAELTARARANLAPTEAPTDGLGTAVEAITTDGSCSSSDDWFFDQPVGVTPVNEVCFTGTGTIDLGTVSRGTGSWADAVESYLGQAYNGHFSGGGECFSFPINSTQTNTIGLEDLTLGSACCTGTKQWCYCSLCPNESFCATSLLVCENWCKGGC